MLHTRTSGREGTIAAHTARRQTVRSRLGSRQTHDHSTGSLRTWGVTSAPVLSENRANALTACKGAISLTCQRVTVSSLARVNCENETAGAFANDFAYLALAAFAPDRKSVV